jgi:fatty acid desaturase
MLSERTKKTIREILLIGVWVFLMWLALTAIDHGDGWLLGVYVFVASTALAGVMYWAWKGNSK